MPFPIQLHVLRHGQAIHNVLAEVQEAKADDVHDPSLTELGRSQASEAGVPPTLRGGVQFWVSPLKRCLETACLALPLTDFWHIHDSLRELAGEKLCDSRSKKSEVIEYAEKTFPHVTKWDFSEIEQEEDELYERPRESGLQVAQRVEMSLQKMFALATERKIEQFVWVSHSAFLSMLFAVLNVLPVEARWLRNGEWRSLTLRPSATIEDMSKRLGPFLGRSPLPPACALLGVSAGAAGDHQLIEVDWKKLEDVPEVVKTQEGQERVTTMTYTGDVSQLFAKTEPLVPALTVTVYPLAQKHLAPAAPDFDQGVATWQSKCETIFGAGDDAPRTPPFVYNGLRSIRAMPTESSARSPLSFERIGLSSFSDLVLVGAMVNGVVETQVLTHALQTAGHLLRLGLFYQINLVFCETVASRSPEKI